MSDDPCRIIVDSEPQCGVTNMAFDAALLEAADARPAGPVVRIYRWSEQTVTVGYFQKAPALDLPEALRTCPQVRRLTGGGAILHHDEITYSCVVPRTHPLRESPLALYEVMHGAILNALTICHVDAGFRARYPLHVTTGDAAHEPYLCFLRSDPRDLVALPYPTGLSSHPKIVGSAQRRRRGTILQHGSILLRASPLLPGVAGISDLFSGFDECRLNEILPVYLAKAVSNAGNVSDYTDHEHQLALKHKQAAVSTS